MSARKIERKSSVIIASSQRLGDVALLSAYDLFRNRLKLQARGALVNLAYVRVAKHLPDRIVVHETISAEKIDGERCDTHRRLRGEELAHGGFGDERLPGVAETRGLVDHQPRGMDVRGRAC